MRRAVLFALAFAMALPSAGRAQLCAAASSFRRHPYRVFGTAAARDSVTFYGGGLSVGSESVFGSAVVGYTTSDELHGFRLHRVSWGYEYQWVYDGALTARLGAGYQLPVDTGSRFGVCPTVDLSFVLGPDSLYGSDVSYREGSLSLGISLGGILVGAGPISLTAAASLAGVYAGQRYEDSFGNSDVDRSVSGFVSLAVGLIVGDALTVRPSVAMPFGRRAHLRPIGIKDGSTRFALTVGMGFGPARR